MASSGGLGRTATRRGGGRKDTTGKDPTGKDPNGKEYLGPGLIELYPKENNGNVKPYIDIVFVPGLGAHPETSWKSDKADFNWATSKDGITKDFPNSRVLLFQYESAWLGAHKVKQTLRNLATTLLMRLDGMREREKVRSRPIIFIGHSMGGLVVAKAISFAFANDRYPLMFESTVGCFFFGTPFGGSDMAVAAGLFASFTEKINMDVAVVSKLLDQMKPRDESLRDLRNEFRDHISKFQPGIKVVCFFEEDATDFSNNIAAKAAMPGLFSFVKGPKALTVTEESATLEGATAKGPIIAQGLPRDHRHLVKFDSSKDETYQLVRGHLKKVIQNATSAVKNRIISTRDINRALVYRLLAQLEGASVSKMRQKLRATLAPSTWMLRDPIFLSWLAKETYSLQQINSPVTPITPRACLWIRGREGRGKTKALLAALDVIESVIGDEDEFDTREPARLAYFFCDRADDCSSAEDLLKSLIRQLITQHEPLVSHARMFEKKTSKGKEERALMSVELLWRTLQDMLADKSIGRVVYFVISNLHTLPEESSSTSKLLGLLQAELQDAPNTALDRAPVRWLFTSQPVNSIQQAIQTDGSYLVDLENPQYEDKVQLELRSHAERKIIALRDEKKYNKALAYFASSFLGKRAQNTHWIDVTCVQLQQLSEMESELKVRRVLEGKPLDLTTLLDEAWGQIFQKVDTDDCEVIKEMLRALVLAYDDPSIQELALLTGIDYANLEARDKLDSLVEGCKPLLVVNRTKGENAISFMSPVVKSHMVDNRGKHLGLSDEETKWHHGVLTHRCFAHVNEQLGREGLVPPEPDDDENDATEGENSGDADSVDGSATDGSHVQPPDEEGSDGDQADEDDASNDDGDEDEDGDDDESSSDEEEEEEEEDYELQFIRGVALAYPVKYWLQHAGCATIEISESLSLEDEFWQLESVIRPRWLLEYNRLTDALSEYGDARSCTALHTAAAFGSVELLSALIKNGHEDEREKLDEWDNTPLHAAAYFGNVEMIEELLNGGSKINVGLEDKFCTPLHGAAYQGHIAAMRKLLKRGAAIDAIDDDVGPVINAAILGGDTDAIKLLVDSKVALAVDYEGLSPLALAAGVSDTGVLDFLIEHSRGSLPPKDYDEALVEAAKAGNEESFKRLLDFPHPDERFEEALTGAALEGVWNIVHSILQIRSGLNCGDAFCAAAGSFDDCIDEMRKMWLYSNQSIAVERLEEALYTASDVEKDETVRYLVEELKVNPDATGEEYGNALTASAFDGTDKILNILLDAGADVNSPHGWALQTAAREGHTEIVRELLRRGASVNECVVNEHFGYGTALHAACEASQDEIVTLLLEHGADANLGPPGNHPIIAATEQAEEDITKQLVEAGANVNVIGGYQKSTPLINAASFMTQETVQLLLDAGADLEMEDEDGDTALIGASGMDDVDCVRFLVSKGANVMHCNHDNENALRVAYDNEQYDNLLVLIQRASGILKAVDDAVKGGNTVMGDLVRNAPFELDTAEEVSDKESEDGAEEEEEDQVEDDEVTPGEDGPGETMEMPVMDDGPLSSGADESQLPNKPWLEQPYSAALVVESWDPSEPSLSIQETGPTHSVTTTFQGIPGSAETTVKPYTPYSLPREDSWEGRADDGIPRPTEAAYRGYHLPPEPSNDDRVALSPPVPRKPVSYASAPSLQQAVQPGMLQAAQNATGQSFSQGYRQPDYQPPPVRYQQQQQQVLPPQQQQVLPPQQQQVLPPQQQHTYERASSGQGLPDQPWRQSTADMSYVPYKPTASSTPPPGGQQYYQQQPQRQQQQPPRLPEGYRQSQNFNAFPPGGSTGNPQQQWSSRLPSHSNIQANNYQAPMRPGPNPVSTEERPSSGSSNSWRNFTKKLGGS